VVRSLTRRGLAAAASLAALAGFVDGFGFVYLGGYFVSFMSGNTTRAGVSLIEGQWPAVGFAFLLISAFVIGAMVGTVVARPARDRSILILSIVGLSLLTAATLAALELQLIAAACLAFGMGAVNTTFAQGGEVSFGVTYMTGALVKIGQGIAHALRGGERWAWVRYLVLWAAIAVGASSGALAFVAYGAGALLLAIIGLLLAGVLIRAARSDRSQHST